MNAAQAVFTNARASAAAGIQAAMRDPQAVMAQAMKLTSHYSKTASTMIWTYGKEHPYMAGTAAAQAGAALVLGPGAIVSYPLKLLGFGPLGPIAGSVAAWSQSTLYGGFIPAGGMFAFLQALGMTI